MKKCAVCIVVLMFSCAIAPVHNIKADEFEGNEEEWLRRCSVPQETVSEVAQCKLFKTYYAEKSADLQIEIDEINAQLEQLESDIDSMAEMIHKQQVIVDELNGRIHINDANIEVIDEQIGHLDELMDETQSKIDVRNALVINRLRDEQQNTGMHMSIEVVMGAESIVDLIRKIDGLKRIMDQDQQEIAHIKTEKAALQLQMDEQTRLRNDMEEKRAVNEEEKAKAQALKDTQETLLEEYRMEVAEFTEGKMSVEADLNALKHYMSSINTAIEGSYSFEGNVDAFLQPIEGNVYSGTWHYAGGAPHLGADVAVPIGTPIYAPANGIILYVGNGFPTNGGFLLNWVGWPSGAGNDIHMLTQVDEITYAVSFFHMSNEGMNVLPGESVLQGNLLGLTGNSGNSSGPHCHIEVINLGNMAIHEAIEKFQETADFSWGTGWEYTGLVNVCGLGSVPCRERPEEVFGYE